MYIYRIVWCKYNRIVRLIIGINTYANYLIDYHIIRWFFSVNHIPEKILKYTNLPILMPRVYFFHIRLIHIIIAIETSKKTGNFLIDSHDWIENSSVLDRQIFFSSLLGVTRFNCCCKKTIKTIHANKH